VASASAASNPGSGGSSNAQPGNQNKSQTEQVSTDGNIFIRIFADKKNVMQGEYLTVTVKLYSKLNITSIDNVEFPTFEGFFKQDIETPPIRSLERENVNGEIYGTGVLKKFILIPQKNGELKINPMTLDCNVQQQVRSRGVFDDFFGPSVQTVPVKLKSKPVTINVKPLPANTPESFNGAVGKFTFDAKLDKKKVKTNDAITLKINISGNGNIKLIDAPKINFPPDFDTYDPKVTLNTSATNGGVSGSKIFEYLLIPRNPGEFNISPVAFTYFDVASNQYKTLSSGEFDITVEKGAETQATSVVSGLAKEDVKFIGKDILFIKTNNFSLSKINTFFFGSIWFYLIYIVGIILFAVVVWMRRRIIRQNANVAFVRNRMADKFASKRLKQANIHLKANAKEQFYEEVLKAIWGYLSDKLNISLSELSRDTARDILEKRNVDEQTVQLFIQIVDNCEYARYAPASSEITLHEDYDKAIELITKLQQKLR
jgi:hypothetical protein